MQWVRGGEKEIKAKKRGLELEVTGLAIQFLRPSAK